MKKTFFTLVTASLLSSTALFAAVCNTPTVGAISYPPATCVGTVLYMPSVPTVTDNGSAISGEGWEILRDGTWTPFSNPVTTADTKLRYFATNDCGTSYSNEVNLTIIGRPALSNIATPAATCTDTSLNLPVVPTVVNNGATISAQGWQILRDGTWTFFSNPVTTADTKLRFFATNTCGTTYSNEVNLNIIKEIEFNLPYDFAVCPGAAAELKAELIDDLPVGSYTMWWKKGASDTIWEFIAGVPATIDLPKESTVYRFETLRENRLCPNVGYVNVNVVASPQIMEITEVGKNIFEIKATGGTTPYKFSIDIDIKSAYQYESTFEFIQSGTHTAYITDYNGCKNDKIFIVAPLENSIPSYIAETQIIYPNPTTDIVFVGKTSNIKLYNAQSVLLQEITDNQIDLSPYPQGIYFLQVNGVWNKVVKK